MPIYAYRCAECGHDHDALQKMSDAPLTDCPACGKASLVKQVTAAGFQLKGSGWYVTDFRNGQNKGANSSGGTDKGANSPSDSSGGTDKGANSPSDSSGGSGSTESAPGATPAPAASTATPAS
ncbi:MAG: FmdB family zinc ribbon protein [Pigmentiphaga sp.]